MLSSVSHPFVDGGHPWDISFLTAAAHPASSSFRNSIWLDHGLDHALCRQAFRQLAPGCAAIRGFENASAVSVPGGIFPGALPGFPQRCVDRFRMCGIDFDVVGAGVLVLVEHLFKSLAAVGGTENAALRVRTVGMAEHRDKKAIGIARIDGDLRNLLAFAEAEMRPGPACVVGFINAVADRKIGALEAFAAADVDDVCIRRSDRDGADGTTGLIIEDGLPGSAEVGGLPHAAIDHANVKEIWLTGNAGASASAAAAQWSDGSPAQVREEF